MNIKIILADDHQMLREGLRRLIEEQQGMTVIAEADDGRATVELATRLKPDIVVMDIAMPRMNGMEATRHIMSKTPNVKVLALSMHTDRRFIVEMLSAGASGYLLKECAFQELITAIHALADQRTYLSPKISDMIVKDYTCRFPHSELSSLMILTAREREVLQLMAEGKPTRDIASILLVSAKTVETYRQQIMEKLDIHSVAELTKFAVREGLTSL
ncbi:MAG: response regulator transcription factor [Nitrospirae bacterium]|nr:response regulator transcription factor [Nitrospirota bacterium]